MLTISFLDKAISVGHTYSKFESRLFTQSSVEKVVLHHDGRSHLAQFGMVLFAEIDQVNFSLLDHSGIFSIISLRTSSKISS